VVVGRREAGLLFCDENLVEVPDRRRVAGSLGGLHREAGGARSAWAGTVGAGAPTAVPLVFVEFVAHGNGQLDGVACDLCAGIGEQKKIGAILFRARAQDRGARALWFGVEVGGDRVTDALQPFAEGALAERFPADAKLAHVKRPGCGSQEQQVGEQPQRDFEREGEGCFHGSGRRDTDLPYGGRSEKSRTFTRA